MWLNSGNEIVVHIKMIHIKGDLLCFCDIWCLDETLNESKTFISTTIVFNYDLKDLLSRLRGRLTLFGTATTLSSPASAWLSKKSFLKRWWRAQFEWQDLWGQFQPPQLGVGTDFHGLIFNGVLQIIRTSPLTDEAPPPPSTAHVEESDNIP